VINPSPAWRMSYHGYIFRTVGQTRLYLHREVMQRVEPSLGRRIADHLNGVTHDCRRENLRWATHQQNAHNRHQPPRGKVPYFGVAEIVDSGNFRAYIWDENRHVPLGVYATAEEAAHAYNAAAIARRGTEHVRLNDVPVVELRPIGRFATRTPGVRPHGNRYSARAKVKGVEHHIGVYDTEEEAILARRDFIAAS
jgi:hypothetical protein